MKKYIFTIITLFLLLISTNIAFSQNADEWHKTGSQFLINKGFENAIKAFSKTIELNPNNTNSYLGRLMSYSATNMFPEAIADCTSVLVLDPKNSNILFTRGQLYQVTGDNQRSLYGYIAAAKLGDESAQKLLTGSNIPWE